MPICNILRAAALVIFSITIIFAAESKVSDQYYGAIRSDDMASLRTLLRTSDVNSKDSHGTTPLMYAAAVGSFEAMKALVAAGADVNAKNAFDATALMWCAGDIDKVRLLLAKGADVNAKSKIGQAPLLLAALHDGSSEAVKLLLEKGADVKVRGSGLLTAVNAAAIANDDASVRLLLAKGAEPDVKDMGGFTALANAALNGNAGIMKMLLTKNADVNASSIPVLGEVKNGPLGLGLLTPLMGAVLTGNLESVELLVNAGANVNAKDARGLTALTWAIATDRPNPRIVRYLLAKGAESENPIARWGNCPGLGR